MSNITRRDFIKAAAASSLLLSPGFVQSKSNSFLEPVQLGKTNIKVTRLALGSGTDGWEKSSAQTRAGMEQFKKMAHHAYDRGIRFFESADIYGSHTYFREVFKEIPREKIILETKVWNRQLDWNKYKGVDATIDRFRQELGTDYLDIVLMHCMGNGTWTTEYAKDMDALSELKAKGIIKAVGISCHNLDAIKTAAVTPWVDVIQARINAFGPLMDDTPEKVMPELATAHANGKGIIGMKIYGCRKCVEPDQRQKSLEFIWNSGNVTAATIGFTETEHIDDTISRCEKIFATL